MKSIAVLTAASLLWTSAAYGQCNKPVTLLQPNEPAPCRGYLFTPEKEQEIRLLNEDYKFLSEKLRLKDQQIDLYIQEANNYQAIADMEKEKAEMWRKAAEDSSLRLIEKEEKQERRDWLHVLAGVGLTVLAGWAIGQAAK